MTWFLSFRTIALFDAYETDKNEQYRVPVVRSLPVDSHTCNTIN